MKQRRSGKPMWMPIEILAYLSEWRKNNAELFHAGMQQWHADHRQEQNAKRSERYRENRESHYQKTNAWRLAHVDRDREYKRAYNARHPEKMQAYVRLRQATKLQRTPPWLSAEQRKEMVAFYLEARRIGKETGIKHHVDPHRPA